MPPLPKQPGLYLWDLDGTVKYVGSTRTNLFERLGSRQYSTISNYNTFARKSGKKGGQQTNCRINALANEALCDGDPLSIWYRVTAGGDARAEEAWWMTQFGKPEWNQRRERED